MLKQPTFVSPPLTIDVSTLRDYTAVIQKNLQTLYASAHTHKFQTTAPATSDGNVGDTLIVQLGTSPYLYIKFPDPLNWKRVLLS